MTKEAAKNVIQESSLEEVPINLARLIRTSKELTDEQKRELLYIVRSWVSYSRQKSVDDESLFILRWHLQEFAEMQFSEGAKETVDTNSVDLGTIELPDGNNVRDFIVNSTSDGIHEDDKVAIFGGTARVALKALAFQNGEIKYGSLISELPISDVDLIVEGPENAEAVSKKYGSDLTGTKIVEDISKIEKLLTHIDLTINQVLMYKGELFYTNEAYQDVVSGRIQNLDQNSALFGRETFTSPNGRRYLTAQAMYRSFSFLLRKKGDYVEISPENLEAEKKKLKKYWAVILFVKLIPYAIHKGNEILFHWVDLAQRLGLTQQTTPTGLLLELKGEYPELSRFGGGKDYDEEAQLKWLVGKVVKQAILRSENKSKDFEDRYDVELSSPEKIYLTDTIEKDDFQAKLFWETISTL